MDDLPLHELRAELQRLRGQVAERDRLIARQQRTIHDLQQRFAAALRAAKRQAAPFSQGPPKPHPKRPGRNSGAKHGRHGHRPPPAPPQVDQVLEARLPAHCPGCDGDLTPTHVDQQFQTEIPRRPIVRQFNIQCGHCQRCGQSCRGRHPLQTSDATGAAASHLGPDAQTAIRLPQQARRPVLRQDRGRLRPPLRHPPDARRLCPGRAAGRPAAAARL